MSNEYPSSTRVLQKKPSESAFKQQKLPAWQPILTASTVLPTFLVIGVAFIPLGIGILIFSEQVQEIVIDYTHCDAINNSVSGFEKKSCADILEDNNPVDCLCNVNFTLDTDFTGNVYMYYGLTNFYQNHRRYVKSRDDVQLLGQLNNDVSADCKPYDYGEDNKPIAPCGAIANSMFNDELELFFVQSPEIIRIPLIKTGIAWSSDKEIKFRNPEGDLQKAFKNFAKPRNWKKSIWELDPHDPSNNGFKNEDFIVWMRTAALPNFRKLYRRIDHRDHFRDGLPKGTYTLKVKYFYRVIGFGGTKSMILSTTSILGAKNPFLGYAYIAVGSLCLIVGVMFLLIHIKYGKSTAEVVNVTPTTSYQ